MNPAGPLRGVGIGAGYFSQFHYEAWSRIAGADIVAIHDRDEARAREKAARYGIPRVRADWRAMIRVKPLGAPATAYDYAHEDRNFGGDCVFAVQQHFVHGLRSGEPFESHGREYLKTRRIVEAAYHSAGRAEAVRLPVESA